MVFFILADKNDSKMIHVHKARYHENRGISFALLQVLTFGGQNRKKISIFGTIKYWVPPILYSTFSIEITKGYAIV